MGVGQSDELFGDTDELLTRPSFCGFSIAKVEPKFSTSEDIKDSLIEDVLFLKK